MATWEERVRTNRRYTSTVNERYKPGKYMRSMQLTWESSERTHDITFQSSGNIVCSYIMLRCFASASMLVSWSSDFLT
jgi:hypothetical protein